MELVQPLSGKSVYSEFLQQGKEGFHHLSFDLSQEAMEQALTVLKEIGIEVIQRNGSGPGQGFAYLNTDQVGGTIFKFRCRG